MEPSSLVPRSVYRRRRLVAVAGLILIVVLIGWLVGLLTSKGSEKSPEIKPQALAASQSSTSPMLVSAKLTRSAASSSNASTEPVRSTEQSQTSAVVSEQSAPAHTGPPQPCDDAQIAVSAEVDRPSYAVGDQARFSIIVTNTGSASCSKDIGRQVRELVVTTADGSGQLWSSNDCFATGGSEVRILRPGERFDYHLTWLGSTSEPGCGKHTRLNAGDYLLVAKVAGKASSPVVFRLT